MSASNCEDIDYWLGVYVAGGCIAVNLILIIVLLCVKSYQEHTSPFRSFIEKRNCYIALIIHTFDQSIDIGVAFDFYLLWNGNCDEGSTQRHDLYLFGISACSIIVYRVISCVLVMVRTHSQSYLGIFQLFDLYVFYGIIINYKYLRNKLSKPQKWFHYLQCLFEAFPMLLIQIYFLINTANTDNDFGFEDTLVIFVIVSLVFSLLSVILSVVIQDLTYFSNKNDTTHAAITSDADKENDSINSKLLIIFRFINILFRFALLSMIWIVLGGFYLCCVLAFEFIVLCVFSYKYSDTRLLLYLILIPIRYEFHQGRRRLFLAFVIYRVASNVAWIGLFWIFYTFELYYVIVISSLFGLTALFWGIIELLVYHQNHSLGQKQEEKELALDMSARGGSHFHDKTNSTTLSQQALDGHYVAMTDKANDSGKPGLSRQQSSSSNAEGRGPGPSMMSIPNFQPNNGKGGLTDDDYDNYYDVLAYQAFRFEINLGDFTVYQIYSLLKNFDEIWELLTFDKLFEAYIILCNKNTLYSLFDLYSIFLNFLKKHPEITRKNISAIIGGLMENVIRLEQFRTINSTFSIINNEICLLDINIFSPQICYYMLLHCNSIQFKEFTLEQAASLFDKCAKPKNYHDLRLLVKQWNSYSKRLQELKNKDVANDAGNNNNNNNNNDNRKRGKTRQTESKSDAVVLETEIMGVDSKESTESKEEVKTLVNEEKEAFWNIASLLHSIIHSLKVEINYGNEFNSLNKQIVNLNDDSIKILLRYFAFNFETLFKMEKMMFVNHTNKNKFINKIYNNARDRNDTMLRYFEILNALLSRVTESITFHNTRYWCSINDNSPYSEWMIEYSNLIDQRLIYKDAFVNYFFEPNCLSLMFYYCDFKTINAIMNKLSDSAYNSNVLSKVFSNSMIDRYGCNLLHYVMMRNVYMVEANESSKDLLLFGGIKSGKNDDRKQQEGDNMVNKTESKWKENEIIQILKYVIEMTVKINGQDALNKMLDQQTFFIKNESFSECTALTPIDIGLIFSTWNVLDVLIKDSKCLELLTKQKISFYRENIPKLFQSYNVNSGPNIDKAAYLAERDSIHNNVKKLFKRK